MIRVNRWTAAALTATFLLIALLIAGTKVLEAEPADKGNGDENNSIENNIEQKATPETKPIEHRAVNKRIKDFPTRSTSRRPRRFWRHVAN